MVATDPKAEGWVYHRNGMIPSNQQLPKGIIRMAAVVEYDGSDFCGWQRQRHSPSVQAEVERALSVVAAEPIVVVCAGRTDSGVSGTNQFIHFDSSAQRQSRNWILGANANLPDTIRLHWAEQMPGVFHARFSATARTYRYIICNDKFRPALFCRGLTWVRQPLNAEAMHAAAQHLLGERDFTSLRGAGCQSNTPFRNVHYIEVWRQGDLVVLEVRANAFLLHMVRNIAGVLISVGMGTRAVDSVVDLMAAKDRCHGEVTAHPNGLYLVAVNYPPELNVPSMAPGPHFIPNALHIPVEK